MHTTRLVRSFGDAAGFGDAGMTSVHAQPQIVRARKKGFGDASDFGDAGGFDYFTTRTLRPQLIRR
jgi:hypothetical protein